MKKVFFALMLGLAAVACTKEYDDSALKNQLGNLEDRVEAIEEEIATLTNEVNGMKTLAQALRDGKYITSYEAYAGEDGRTGYTLTFSDNSTVVVYNGVKGETGETGETGPAPALTVAEKDGELYWFVGTDALAPVYEAAPVFTSNDGKLYVQFGEQEPVEIGTLTGKSIFEDVKVEGENMVFTFLPVEGETEGYSVSVPLANVFTLVIRTEVGLAEGATAATLPYTVKGANAATVVDFIAFGCKAALTTDAIEVTEITEGAYLIVFADNQEGKTSIKKVAFAAESVTVETVDYLLPIEGGQVVVKGDANIDFDVVIPAEATWLTQVATKSAFELTFAVAANDTKVVRTAEVSLVRKGTEEVVKSITIAQEKPFASFVNAFQSHGATSYLAAFGASAGKDRNIAINDEYLFIPETQGTPVMWKVSLADGTATAMPVGTVVGANVTFALSCPRFIKNTDPAVNGGNDVLVVSSMGMGGQEGYLYFYKNGVTADPHKVALNLPGGGGRRLGDKMSVYGTMQNWAVYYKEQGTSAIVNYAGTVNVLNVDNIWAAGRNHMQPTNNGDLGGIYFYSKDDCGVKGLITTHTTSNYGVVNSGIVFESKPVYEANEWATEVDYKACHGFNFFKHDDKDYIAYTSFTEKKLYVIKGASSSEGVKAALEAREVVFEASIAAEDNACAAGNSAADCSVYQKDGKTFVAGHIQNIGVVVYQLN